MVEDCSILAKQLGHSFLNPELLQQALTHPSWENPVGKRGRNTAKKKQHFDYQRLEFLGDRVLAVVTATMLYEAFPHELEGDMARRHVALVRREALVLVAEQWELGQYIILSKGEEDYGGRSNPSNLADAVEAVLGALYIDGGFDLVNHVIRRAWIPLMDQYVTPPQDAKTALQEWSQKYNKGQLPIYHLVSNEGPSHSPHFVISVTINEHEAVGEGHSKRLADQAAASILLEKVRKL